MTHIDNRLRIAALPGLLLGLGWLSAAPPAIAAQPPTGPDRISLAFGIGAVLPADVRFVDGKDAGEAPLYGDDKFDTGTLGPGWSTASRQATGSGRFAPRLSWESRANSRTRANRTTRPADRCSRPRHA